MQRRAQQPISIRSNRAAELLTFHTRFGRSQAAVIEEALERLPAPRDEDEARRQAFIDGIRAIQARIPPGSLPSMAEFDAMEYDEFGNPR